MPNQLENYDLIHKNKRWHLIKCMCDLIVLYDNSLLSHFNPI